VRRGAAFAACLLLGLCAPAALAAPSQRKGKVVSVRGQRVYVQVSGVGPTLEPDQLVRLRVGDREVDAQLVAASSKFLLLELDEGESLEADDQVVITGGAAPPPPGPAEAMPGPSTSAGGSEISVGRAQPTLHEWLREPEPERELVAFRGVAPTDEGEARAEAAPEDEPRVEDNEVVGELELGVDGAFQDKGDIDRTTPFARLRFEVRRLFGSDRASFLFYGSARQDFGGTQDWTGQREDDLNARFATMAFRLNARPSEQIDSFGDRIELVLGRDTVRDVVEAGVVDGFQGGVRFGPLMPFGFLGFAGSPNPRRYDYDSVTWGAGFRFAQAFEHSGAIRFSVAYSEEAFRGKGERRFVEGRADVRFGRFGMRGGAVYDFWSSLEDSHDHRLTTGELLLHLQATDDIRLEAGYRERRPVYTAELIQIDLEEALETVLVPNPTPPPEGLVTVADVMEESARRNVWATARIRFAQDWDFRVRGEHFQARESRDHTGVELGLGVSSLLGRDRLGVDVAYRHRQKGNGIEVHATEPYVRLSYSVRGESVRWLFTAAYRLSIPEETGDGRLALRADFDSSLTEWFGFRGYGELDFVRGPGEGDDTLLLAGLALRLSF
jgi:hypothetical protein